MHHLLTGQATIIVKEPSVLIQCMSGAMLITINNAPANYDGVFSGMVYPKGLAKNSTCLSEYRHVLLHEFIGSFTTCFIVSPTGIIRALYVINFHFAAAILCHKKP